jgi:hypothetical protein
MSANQQEYEGASSREEARQRLITRAIERAQALLAENPSMGDARLHPTFYENMSDKTIEAWIKEVDGNDEDESSSSDGDRGTRATHNAAAGKNKKKGKAADQTGQSKVAEKAVELAENVIAGKHGIDIDRDALKIDALNENDYFMLTKEHQKILCLPPTVTHIPFLIPSKLKDTKIHYKSMFAVRLNEAFEDAFAIISGERTYSRQLMLRAEQIIIIATNSKNPIMFMSGFATDQITDGTKRACDACAERMTFVQRKQRPTIAIADTAIPQDRNDFRVIGTIEEMNKLMQELSNAEWKSQQRAHHVEGLGVLHAYLTPEELQKVQSKKVSVELKKNIVSSVNMTRQLTIRKTNATSDEMFDLARKLQTGKIIPAISKSATTTFRTHGTLRVTLDVAVTPEVLKALRQQLPTYRMFTDVPINVWAPAPGDGTVGTINVPRPSKPQPVRKPLPNDRRLVRIAADYEPHPDTFTKIAEFFKGSVHSIREPRFTDRPMDALISVPKDVDYSSFIAEGFAIDARGSWTMEPVCAAFGAAQV